MDGTGDDQGSADEARYWYNPGTGEVEEGMVSPWTNRMGPYPTREAAQHALDRAAARSDAWDEEDRRWQQEGWGERSD